MLRTAARSAARTSRCVQHARTGALRAASTSSSSEESYPPPPPPPSYFTAATIYPFILLSAITSLALNLSHQRTARETEGSHYRAQVSVLESLVAKLRESGAGAAPLTAEQQEEIERELELVGLGRGEGKLAVDAEGGKRAETSWTEVFLGKKGKGYEEEDTTDWEKVFREADEAEKARATAVPSPVAPPPTPAPAPAPSSAVPSTPSPEAALSSASSPPSSSQKPPSRAVYL
ncbi:hypothetical protein JCM6882_006701 [Rhodosporidiobolus microsporus]